MFSFFPCCTKNIPNQQNQGMYRTVMFVYRYTPRSYHSYSVVAVQFLNCSEGFQCVAMRLLGGFFFTGPSEKSPAASSLCDILVSRYDSGLSSNTSLWDFFLSFIKLKSECSEKH